MKARATCVLVVVALGCGSGADDGAGDASPDRTVSDAEVGEGGPDATVGDASNDTSDAGKITPLDAWFKGYNLVDGGTLPDGAGCGNTNWYKFGIVETCCNGVVCEGFCEGLSDGGTRCNCFGIIDGCTSFGDAAACCFDSRGCGNRNLCAKGL